MGFQSSLNQALGAVAGAAYAIKGEADKKEAKADAKAKEKIALAKEDVSLTEEAAKLESDRNKILNSDEYKLLNIAVEHGSTEKDKAIASKELKKYKESLNILDLKIKANEIQRADWKRRMGGIK